MKKFPRSFMLPLLLALCLALTACTDAAQPAASGTSAAQASPSASASASAQEATPAPAAEDVATLVQGASESMILVNADNPVGEGFQPPALKSLKSLITQPVKLDDDSIQADPCVADAMNAMLSAAKADGEATMRIQNGYRSYKRQKEIFDSTVNYHKTQEKKTEQEAMTITKSKVAVPGYSEHHTGLCFDFGSVEADGIPFGQTAHAAWLKNNVYKYGFIIRYPEDKQSITGTIPEPWHVRYVGLPHSEIMQKQGLCLEEYWQALQSGPITETVDSGTYQVYYAPEGGSLTLPQGERTIASDGRGGVVVAVKVS